MDYTELINKYYDNYDEWTIDNINYRLFNCKQSNNLNASYDDIKNIIPENIPTFMIVHEKKLVSISSAHDIYYVRPNRFLKYCNYFNFNKTYLTNFCDASGWDYNAILDSEIDLPVFQFSRRKSQRNKVILWPLSKKYMNISKLPKDDMPFDKKHDSIVWRGRVSGTYTNNWKNADTNLFWIESVVGKSDTNPTEKEMQQIFNVQRYKVVSEVSNTKYCDVAFTANQSEYDNIIENKIKCKYFKKLLGTPTTINKQREHKYILAVSGNCYPTSLYWSLLSNSVVFLVNTEWETILDCNLKPWVHYVPVDPSHDNIMEKFEHMQSHPDLAKEIINNAHNHLEYFANDALRDKLDYLTMCHYGSGNIPHECTLGNVSFTMSDLGITGD